MAPVPGMASQFCMKCGTALSPEAAFCSNCGTPVAAPPPSPTLQIGPGRTLTPPRSPAAASTAGLVSALGLQGQRSFLVQHQVLSLGHSYRVMDPQRQHLFTVQGNTGQNLLGNALGSRLGGSGSYLGRMVTRSVNMTYTLVHPGGAALGTILKEGGPNQSTFTLADSSGQGLFVISLQRGLMGGITATAASANGRPMLQASGNLIRHNFMIKDPQGVDQAKVHEAWVAIPNTYNVDMIGRIDPVYPLVFTILIDFEKVK